MFISSSLLQHDSLKRHFICQHLLLPPLEDPSARSLCWNLSGGIHRASVFIPFCGSIRQRAVQFHPPATSSPPLRGLYRRVRSLYPRQQLSRKFMSILPPFLRQHSLRRHACRTPPVPRQEGLSPPSNLSGGARQIWGFVPCSLPHSDSMNRQTIWGTKQENTTSPRLHLATCTLLSRTRQTQTIIYSTHCCCEFS